ncbi:unnamed protein product (macronuclear) [Paramecium tetraurelia]|uniref:GPI ethanolamine phosphate transferase 3 n=1 Tax=Paramecium tetraurelia TaxID=5888 RepID=A0DMK6_PARTE|nr:uncharacterized protein GSPATT00018491001 [Paramecium tetraurelia]CAK84273.1 unnamed protein product [Paramecium tetraurelia]|eukprot:XP_001451670.1 hypothetical protein (macronuclear) [Paramecium tetraurelia strain d4-2]
MAYINTLITITIASTLLGLILFFRGVFIDRHYIRTMAQGKIEKTNPVVLIVIDSFRMDLAMSNHFNFISQRRTDSESLTFLSLAETPTVTGPRIQTMTTGNFAPLTKVLDNFHDSEIVEDSFIRQAKISGKKTLFIGDNNWLGLYPNEFTIAHPLNKMKINSRAMYVVDKKFQRLFGQNFDTSFDLAVVHFLGIDYVAHEYNRVSENKVLEEQLNQLSTIITQIYSRLSNDTTLIITGDHGMLNDGNHGGNSSLETNTVFFVTRKNAKLDKHYMQKIEGFRDDYETSVTSKDSYIRTIKQVDIAPTIAKLIGVPIPFSNIGIIIPELFPGDVANEYCVENLKQMFHYSKKIQQDQGLFTRQQIKLWKNQINQVSTCAQAIPIMEDIQHQSRIIWNNYNKLLIFLSMIFQILSLTLYITTLLTIKYVKDFSLRSALEHLHKSDFNTYRNHLYAGILMVASLALFVELEIFIATILILIISIILIYSIAQLIIGRKEQSPTYSTLDLETHRSEFQYFKFFILALFLHKAFRQGSLLFSIDPGTIEHNELFDQIFDLLFMSIILNTLIFLKTYYDSGEQKVHIISLAKSIGEQLMLGVIALILLYLEYIYYQLGLEKSFKSLRMMKSLVHIFFPCILQHILLYYYQKLENKNKFNKAIPHLFLFTVQSYFMVPQIPLFDLKRTLIKSTLKPLIFCMPFVYIYAKDLVYFLIPSLLATTQYGIAIYTYFILFMLLIYRLSKPQLKYNKLICVALISLSCQYTWFMIGNECSISAVQHATKRIGFTTTNGVELLLIIIFILVGPYVGGCLVLKFVEKLFKQQEGDELREQSNTNKETKLYFLLNFYLQILFTQFHSYNNLGGYTTIQFKYIFDVVGYIIICLLVYIE